MTAIGGIEVIDKGFLAEAAVTIHRFVTVGSAARTAILANAAGEAVLGVAQHGVEAADATAGAHFNVRLMGISVVEAGAAVTAGGRVQTDSTGRAIDAVVTVGIEEIAGIAMDAAGSAGDLIGVLLTPGMSHNTATT